MTFHDVLFPVDISYGSTGGPAWSTDVLALKSGVETRVSNWSNARHRFNVAYGIKSPAQFLTMLRFFHARRGRLYPFRYKDWANYTTNADGKTAPGHSDQVLGTGTGALTVFDLLKLESDAAGSWTRMLTKIVASTTRVSINGAEKLPGDATYPWTVNLLTGRITFTAAAPPNTEIVRGGCQFHTPTRFDTDDLPGTYEAFETLSISDIPLVEVREC